MHLYIAYASEDAAVAEQIYLALLGDGHEVFFDRPSLQAGDDFDNRFRQAIGASDVLVFLISPASVQDGCYALTELSYARQQWQHPRDHVLPVVVRRTNMNLVPPYLLAVTALEPRGNVAAEVADVVRRWGRTNGDQSVRKSASAHSRDGAMVALASILTTIGIGTTFSFTYPRVEIELSLVLLFVLISLSFVLIGRRILRALR